MNLKNLKEACGVFATFNAKDAISSTFYGLLALQHRGQDACGIVWKDTSKHNKIQLHKGVGLLNDVFVDFPFSKHDSHSAIGHTRYATTGGVNETNIQPFFFQNIRKQFAIAHNGNISNSYDLKWFLEEKGSIFQSNTDTEIIGHLLIREKKLNLFNSLLKISKKLHGAFSLVLLDENAIYAVRDKWGFRPLCIGEKDGAYFIVSETCALYTIGAKFVRDVKPGEVIRIDENGIYSEYYTKVKTKQQLGSMELIYFARPDSIIDGINVHEFRKKTGIKLAKLFPVKNADIVIPVPDSSISATIGFSEESKLPYECGLIKNRYISRTFIQVNQIQRTNSVRKKLNAVPHIVAGKNVVLIDDSIVRGTTLKQIIHLLKEAGAKEIHIRIASPKIIAPSYYGINISTYDELIAHHYKTTKEIAKFLGVNSIEFLPIKELKKLAKPITLDLSIFTDKRVTKISKEYVENAKKINKGIFYE